jgi:NAD-dependent deacetylase
MPGADPTPPPLGADDLAAAVAPLAADLRAVDRALVLVITGAGISLASGIPTFRGSDPGAVWKRDVTELGTHRFFLEDPVASWQWYLSRFEKVLGAEPNPAHHALVDLERWQQARGGELLLVTQNIDTLHRLAGSRALVEVHGAADRVRCSRWGCTLGAPSGSLPRREIDQARFLGAPGPATLPRCPRCSAILRQHVLWFDETYDEHDDYQWERVIAAAHRAALVLFVGTSFSVGVTALVLERALSRRLPTWSIDPGAIPPPHPRVRWLRAGSELLLPALVRDLASPAGG